MSKVRKDNVSKKMTVLTNYVMKMMVDLGKRAEGDIPCVQQGRRGLHLCWGAQVCHDPPAGQGWEDDGDGTLCLCWGAQARHDKKMISRWRTRRSTRWSTRWTRTGTGRSATVSSGWWWGLLLSFIHCHQVISEGGDGDDGDDHDHDGGVCLDVLSQRIELKE